MNDKIIDGKGYADKIKIELKEKISSLNKILKLVVIQVGNDEASNAYINSKRKLAQELGINFEHIKYESTTNEELIEKIKELNNDSKVNGIIVQLPLPKNLDENLIINSIDYKKDVDGLTNINMGKLVNNQSSLVPCTPKGIIKLLEHYNVEIEGKSIVIVGRSRLVGKPLLHMLLNKNGTVTICHSKTSNLKDFTSKADILIVAVGIPHFITSDMVKDNSVIIDVGINRVDGKLVGDVNFDDALNKVSLITPVPKGVGAMTVVELMENVYLTTKL